jgi:hypothetical protein
MSSPFSNCFTVGWRQGRAFEYLERERQAVLAAPAPRNPPELLAPIRCEVRRPFYLNGTATQVGAVVTLQRHDALSLEALHKVKILP